MTTSLRALSLFVVLLCASVAIPAAEHSATPSVPAPASVPDAKEQADAAEADAAKEDADDDFVEDTPSDQAGKGHGHHHWHGGGHDLVSIGHNSHLGVGEKADSVVSVLGSSTSEGEAGDVVSVLGNTRVTGPVHGDAVAVLGNLYIDSKVEGDAVAVLGSVELGPHAEVDGDLNSVLGGVHRTPESVTHGSVNDVYLGEATDTAWLQRWVHVCFLEARPLALASGIGWAWTLAFLCLAFYVVLALAFRAGVSQCVATLDAHPGHAALTALLAMLLTPVLLVLLCVTVLGIAAVPFMLLILFCVSLFGKAVILAWMGHRVMGHRPGSHPALTVLIGGAIALVLYVIPVVGLVAYKLLGFFGFGAVVYTVLLGQRARQAARAERINGEPVGAGDEASVGASGGEGGSDAAAAAAAGGAAFASPGAAGPEAVQAGIGQTETARAAPGAAQAGVSPQVLAALPRSGFWLRMGALLIDVLLVGFLSSFILGSVHHQSHAHLLVLAIYGACMWKLRGSTVGGIVCDLRVVRVDGRAMEWETAIVRALACFLSLAVCGLGFIWIAFDENHQAWHDKIAGTVVVRVPKGQPLV